MINFGNPRTDTSIQQQLGRWEIGKESRLEDELEKRGLDRKGESHR
jgi:hypothetical protein